jgi:hypothetical protein
VQHYNGIQSGLLLLYDECHQVSCGDKGDFKNKKVKIRREIYIML